MQWTAVQAGNINDPLRVLEQGPDRQRAPIAWCGGVSSICGASESRCNHDGSGGWSGQGQKHDRHRSSPEAIGLHEGDFMAAASPQIHRLELNRQAHHVLNALRCTKRTLLGCGAIQAFADVAAHAIPARYAREDIASEALLRLGFRRYGNRNVRQPPPLARRGTLKLRGGPGANPTLTLQQSPDRDYPSRCSQWRCANDATHNR